MFPHALQSGFLDVGPLTTWTLWITSVVMGLGAAVLGLRARDLTSDAGVRQAIIAVFIPLVAMVAYLGMAMGVGVVMFHVFGTPGAPQAVFWLRYVDWLITTPLLLLGLALFAKADRNVIGLLLGLDVLMIATGLLGGFATTLAYRIVWWLISSGAFLAIVWVLVGPLTRRVGDHSPARLTKFIHLRNALILLWSVYPVVWLLGVEILAIIPLGYETLTYAALDVCTKVGFGYLLLSAVGDLEGASESQSHQTDSGAAAAVD